ncbi:MAG: hypothetical protein HY791_10220 [Deltaproteobacteria bacterium]|nr:hypothetical protein [Deltaproteobacteria bacterium]
MDYSLRRDRGLFTLEKWYADLLTPDGTVLLVYLARMRMFGAPFARVTAELFRPGKSVLRSDAKATRLSGSIDRLDFGPASIEGDRLRFELPGFRGSIDTVPRAAAVTLRAPFLEREGRTLDWRVEIPDADAHAELEWQGERMVLEGRSYRDRVWFDLLPWRFPIKRLVWGRAAAGPGACTWVEAQLLDETIRSSWQSESASSSQPQLEDSRVLLESAVVDLEGLRFGPLRPTLRRLTGDPRETKWAARATLAGHAGVAIHEVVTWG